MLTTEDVDYFDDLEDMFGSRGWKHLTDEARKQIYQFQAEALEARSYEQVCYLRGQAEQLARLVNLPEITATLRAQHELPDDDE